jgi:hypothetical protein
MWVRSRALAGTCAVPRPSRRTERAHCRRAAAVCMHRERVWRFVTNTHRERRMFYPTTRQRCRLRMGSARMRRIPATRRDLNAACSCMQRGQHTIVASYAPLLTVCSPHASVTTDQMSTSRPTPYAITSVGNATQFGPRPHCPAFSVRTVYVHS